MAEYNKPDPVENNKPDPAEYAISLVGLPF